MQNKTCVSSLEELPVQQYRSEDSFNSLMAKVEEGFMSSDKIEAIRQETPKDPRVLSCEQFLTLIKTVSMTSDKITVINIVNKYIPYLTTENAIEILNEISFSAEKLQVLEVIVETLIDATEENKEAIIELYAMSSDKEKAREILENARVRNCIFGTVDENVATFIIDISPSMEATFTNADGQTHRRIDFVKQNIKQTIAEQLRGYQKFNVLTLHKSADLWQETNVEVNPENIQSALDWVDGLSTKPYTNISYPLEVAFKTPEQLEAIYLLTDGEPTIGVRSVTEMEGLVQKLLESRDPKVKIHCISFMLGGNESAGDREQSQKYLETIAFTSGGSFKSFQ